MNIAMLRMWLSLAIDYEGATPEPLPNLDFKVVCGDSLLGPDPSSGTEVQGGLGYSQDKSSYWVGSRVSSCANPKAQKRTACGRK